MGSSKDFDYLEKTVVEDNQLKQTHRTKDVDDKEKDHSKKSRRSRHENDTQTESKRDKERDREREGRDKDRERSKSSRRHDGDKDMDRRSRSRHEGGDRDRDMDRRSRSRHEGGDRDRDMDRRSRSRHENETESESKREKERDREREGRDKDRERSRSSRRHDEDKDRDRDRRSRSRHEEREVDVRRYKDKKEGAEPEADPERDQRTVFAYQMPLKATERDVYEFFSKAGKVRDVRLIMDRNLRRSKGVGYIEFYDVMSVPMAIAMSGQLLMGNPVMVKPSEAEKNLVQSNASGSGSVAGPYGAVDRKLYVGNLHFNMTELQLKQLFEAFGPVELVQLPTDETGHCKGFGFVQFNQLEHAKAALSLNGSLEIAGRVIKVSSVTEHVAAQDSAVKATDLDDDDGGGLMLNAQSRALLMQRLDRSGTATSIAGPVGVPAVNGASLSQQPIPLPMNVQSVIPAQALPALMTSIAAEPIGKPSECLLLKNMFDPATETDPEYDLDIRDDVQEECSKYGRVKHIHVDKNSSGYVYLRFESVEGASGAQQAMHHRWFARRLISAVFLQPYEYDAKFKGAA